jgi:hypothetical protein
VSTEPGGPSGELDGDGRSALAWGGEPAAKLSEGDLARAVAFLESLSVTSPGFLGRPAADGEGSRVREITVSLPEALISAVRLRAGAEAFDRYVAAAVTRQVELDLRAELAELVGSEHGPVSPEAFAHLDTPEDAAGRRS